MVNNISALTSALTDCSTADQLITSAVCGHYNLVLSILIFCNPVGCSSFHHPCLPDDFSCLMFVYVFVKGV